MAETNDTKNAAGMPWYVMVHQNPRWIEAMLLKDSRGDFEKTSESRKRLDDLDDLDNLGNGERPDSREPRGPYAFFVPYQSSCWWCQYPSALDMVFQKSYRLYRRPLSRDDTVQKYYQV